MQRADVRSLIQWAILALFALPYLVLTLFVQPTLDDFCYTAWLHERGFIGNQLWVYGQHSGRIVATALLNLSEAGPGVAFTCVPIVVATFALTIFVFHRMILTLNRVCGGSLGKADTLWLAIALFVLLLGKVDTPAQFAYWLPGIFSYHLAILLIVASFTAALELIEAGPENGAWGPTAVLLLGALLIPLINELFAPAFVALLVLLLILAWTTNRHAALIVGVVLAVALAASAASILAPGNMGRTGLENAGAKQHLGHAILVALHWTALQPMKWIADVGVWALALPLLAIVGGEAAPGRFWPPFLWRAPLAARLVILVAIPLATVFVIILPVTYALGGLPYSRVINSAYALFALAGLIAALAAAAERAPRAMFQQRNLMLAAALTLAASLAGAPNYLDALREIRLLPRTLAVLRERTALLAAAGPADRVALPLIRPVPKFIMAADAGPDPRHWINNCYARYAGVGSIVVPGGTIAAP